MSGPEMIAAFAANAAAHLAATTPLPASPRPSALVLMDLFSPPASPGLSHPYAASTKAAKLPRLYEKRDDVSFEDDDIFNLSDTVGNYDDGASSRTHTTSKPYAC